MNERIDKLMYHAGLTAQGCWDEMDEYDRKAIEKFAELIVRECCQYLYNEAERLYGLSGSEVDPVFQSNFEICAEKCYDNSQGLKEHFGVEE